MMKIHVRSDWKKYLLIFLLLPVIFFSCKSLNPAAVPASILIPDARFSSNVPWVVPKNVLDRIIQEQVPQILFEQNGLDMGNGIEGDLRFSRSGQVIWKSTNGQKLQLILPIRVQGQLGLKKGGLGSFFKSKVPIDKSFSPVMTFDPEINSDWKLEFREFELLDLGGKIDLNILGFEIDLSSIVQREIRNLVAQSFGAGKALFDLKMLAFTQWNKFGKPIILDLENEKMGFSLLPKEVRFTEFFDSNQNLNILLGFDGLVNSHPGGDFTSIAPLPAILKPNSQTQNKLSISLPITVTFAQVDRVLERNIAGRSIQLDSKTTLIGSNFRTNSFGNLISLEFDFVANQESKKPVLGKIFAVGMPFYDIQSQSLGISNVNFKISGTNLGAQTGIGLKKRKIIRQLEKKVVFPLENLLAENLKGIEERLKFSTPYADFKLDEFQLSSLSVYPTKSGLSIAFQMEGKMDIVPKFE